MNHHISSIKRELDAAYASIRYFQERDEEYQEEISILKYEKLEGLDRERDYRVQITQKDELIREITNKLAKYSRLLQESPDDQRIHEKIRKYRIKVMKLAGISEDELTEKMDKLRLWTIDCFDL